MIQHKMETLPFDGKERLFYSPLGGWFIGPSTEDMVKPLTTAEQRQLYEATGMWPNVGWNPIRWMDLPEVQDEDEKP